MFATLMGLKTISPRDLHDLMQREAVATIDVNAQASWLRARVPGAMNLDPTGFRGEDLPANKAALLVFYCSNLLCRKAPNAARRAKGSGYTIEFRSALQTYWENYYVNGGKPIDSAKAGAAVEEKPPLIDYKDFQAQITNDMRDQLRRVLQTEPTEDQVRAQTQYILRTAADLQKIFRRKEYGSYSSQALTEATERAIGGLEESPYHQDIQVIRRGT